MKLLTTVWFNNQVEILICHITKKQLYSTLLVYLTMLLIFSKWLLIVLLNLDLF